jgi:hypothetical protein
MKRGRATSLDTHKDTIPTRRSPAGAATNGHPVWEQSTAAARCLLPLASSLLADIPPPLWRGWFVGRSLGFVGRLWRLVALRHIVPASSRFLRRGGGGRRGLFRPALLAVALRSRCSLRVRRPLLPPCAAASWGGCARVPAPSGVMFFKDRPTTPPLRPLMRVAGELSGVPERLTVQLKHILP